MRTSAAVLRASATVADLRRMALHESTPRGQYLYPVVDAERRVRGVITRKALRRLIDSAEPGTTLGEVAGKAEVAYSDEPLRVVVHRMAESGFTRMPVVESGTQELAGMISLSDLLQARTRNLEEERKRERVLHVRVAGV